MEIERNGLIQKLTDLLIDDLVEIAPASDGYHNQVFIITRSTDRIVARLSSRSDRTLEDIETELDWIAALDGAGVRVAKPMSIQGYEQIIELETEESTYWLVFFQHTEGRPVDVSDVNEWNEELFHEWGSQIACMHSADTNRIARPVYLEVGAAKPMPDWLKSRHEQLFNQMVKWERRPDTFGLVHNDLHQGNFHLNENGLVFFDFDDCTYHFYAQDLAVSLYHALWTGTAFNPDSESFPVDFLTAFLKGYAKIRRLTLDMYDQLLICLQMREVYLYALFVSEWNEDEMMDWQFDKLQELEMNIKSNTIPYYEELEQVKDLFE
ncbi:phosphotransferase enzyme family protein [Sporosarcina koreensis]|uniref:Phosphotransferase enzyme family protein n=1 Tax=Sporosarcina koreensis TaxID=334735 RepID=A0ABW0TWS7_9BACL